MNVPCQTSVVFSYDDWIARYPEFAAVNPTAAQMFFDEAQLYLRNAVGRPIRTLTALRALLYMLAAHIAQLNSPTTSQGANSGTPPGQIVSAGEGSVSVAFQNAYPPGTVQWYQQTKYGSAYWAATIAYRQFLYLPGRPFSPGLASVGQAPWLYPNGA